MINNVIIVGQVKTPPSLKKTEKGLSMGKCVVEYREGGDKNKHQWIHINAFGKPADSMENIKKDDYVSVVGKIETRKYEEDGKKNYFTYVNASKFSLLQHNGPSLTENTNDDELGF